MVVKVRLENGRETWLDPSNPETIKAVENQYGSKVVLIDGKPTDKIVDLMANAHNKLVDLKTDLNKAKKRSDKEEIKRINTQIKTNQFAKKTIKNLTKIKPKKGTKLTTQDFKNLIGKRVIWYGDAENVTPIKSISLPRSDYNYYKIHFEGGSEEGLSESELKDLANGKLVIPGSTDADFDTDAEFDNTTLQLETTMKAKKGSRTTENLTFRDEKDGIDYTVKPSQTEPGKWLIFSSSKNWTNRDEGIILVSKEDAIEVAKDIAGITPEFPNLAKKGLKITKNLTELNSVEDKAWVISFNYAIEEKGMNDEQADKYAWKDIQNQFVRLKNFDGIKPNMAKQGTKITNATNEPLYNVVEANMYAVKVSATPDMYHNITKQGVIDLANSMSHYERMDNDEPEITDFKSAKKLIELEGDWKVVQIAKQGILTESQQNTFLWKDHSGRGEKPILLKESHIRKTWDLTDIDNDNETTLAEFLDNSEPGSVWENGTETLENIGVSMAFGGLTNNFSKEQIAKLKELEKKFQEEEPGTPERMAILSEMHKVRRMDNGGRISFDEDSNSYWVNNTNGAGQKSFETWDEADAYLDGHSEPEEEYHPTLFFNGHPATKEEIDEAFKNWGKMKTGGKTDEYIFKDSDQTMLKNAFLFTQRATETDDYFVVELAHNGHDYMVDWMALDGSGEGSVGFYKTYQGALTRFNDIIKYIKNNWEIVSENYDVPYEASNRDGEMIYDAPNVSKMLPKKAKQGIRFQPWLYGKQGIKTDNFPKVQYKGDNREFYYVVDEIGDDYVLVFEEKLDHWKNAKNKIERREYYEEIDAKNNFEPYEMPKAKKGAKIGSLENWYGNKIKAKQGAKIKQYPDLSHKEPMIVKDNLFSTFKAEKPTIVKDKKNKKDTGTLSNVIPQVELVRMGVEVLDDSFERKITSPDHSANIFYKIFPENKLSVQEFFYVLYTDRQNNVIAYYNVSKGGIAGTVVDVELICSIAVKLLAKGIVVGHNHPSGNLKPSQEDIQITKKMKEAFHTLDIVLMDHIIVVRGQTNLVNKKYYSFANEGQI